MGLVVLWRGVPLALLLVVSRVWRAFRVASGRFARVACRWRCCWLFRVCGARFALLVVLPAWRAVGAASGRFALLLVVLPAWRAVGAASGRFACVARVSRCS